MPSTVTLEISNGPLKGQRFKFPGTSQIVVGRGGDCTIQIPEAYDGVSRHHCAIEINLTQLTVKDLGSLNGTYLNGRCIGRREKNSAPAVWDGQPLTHHVLKDRDELRLGRNPGQRGLTVTIHAEPAPASIVLNCAVCGDNCNVSVGTSLLDKFVCLRCRTDCEAMRRHLEAVDEAEGGLASISNYELLQKIGQGGFGSVFLARHHITNRKVALKVMLPHIAQNPLMRRIFEREIENMKALRHPHIVELFEDDCEGALYYFTMEYCALGNVSGLLKKRGGALPVSEALELIHQAIDGLNYAHQATIPNVRLANGSYASGRGLVHRDVKPCNLLLSEKDGKLALKVGDYGMSKAWEQAGHSGVTRLGTRAGSFAYQPRQQVRSYRDAQPEVDVWAMAATLYFMLTGSTPRELPRGVAPEIVVLQHPVIKIRERNPSIPKRLAEAIDNALIDEPAIVVKDMVTLRRSLEMSS